MIYVDGGAKLRGYTPDGARLVDIGCGTGRTTLAYAEGMRGVQLHGIDGFHAPETVNPAICFIQQDIDGKPLPYPDDHFDVAVLCHILEHMRDPVGLFKEVNRVLRDGGLIYVETPSLRSLFVPQVRLFNDQYAAANFYDDYTHVGRPQTIHSLHHLIDRNGFDVVEVEYARPRRWLLRGLRLIASGLKHKKRPILCTGIWHLSGWAIYGVGRKNRDKKVPSYV